MLKNEDGGVNVVQGALALTSGSQVRSLLALLAQKYNYCNVVQGALALTSDSQVRSLLALLVKKKYKCWRRQRGAGRARPHFGLAGTSEVHLLY